MVFRLTPSADAKAVETLQQHKPFLTSKMTEFVLDDYIRRGELGEDAPRDAIRRGSAR